MNESPFKMKFDPLTIKHLGVRMYSTLPSALAEIISNAYDADATNVIITLFEEKGSPNKITIEDDGIGLSQDEINDKFLTIGRNRRQHGENVSPKYKRLPTGKKGLGKLALFGLAETITISTRKEGKQNDFVLDWNALLAAKGEYRPEAKIIDTSTKKENGTTISLTQLKRKTSFEVEELADSLSRIFIIDRNFNLFLKPPSGKKFKLRIRGNTV